MELPQMQTSPSPPAEESCYYWLHHLEQAGGGRGEEVNMIRSKQKEGSVAFQFHRTS